MTTLTAVRQEIVREIEDDRGTLPQYTTATRPTLTSSDRMAIYNTTTDRPEYWTGSTWRPFESAAETSSTGSGISGFSSDSWTTICTHTFTARGLKALITGRADWRETLTYNSRFFQTRITLDGSTERTHTFLLYGGTVISQILDSIVDAMVTTAVGTSYTVRLQARRNQSLQANGLTPDVSNIKIVVFG